MNVHARSESNYKQIERQRILEAISEGLIETVDELAEDEYQLMLEFHSSREELEALFDELRGPGVDD